MTYTKKLRDEWREEIKRYPQMDSLGSADWWIEKITQALAEDRKRVRDWAKSKKEKLTMKWDEDKAKSTVYDSIIFSWDDFPSLDKPLTDKK